MGKIKDNLKNKLSKLDLHQNEIRAIIWEPKDLIDGIGALLKQILFLANYTIHMVAALVKLIYNP